MAGAKAGVHVVKLKAISVPDALVEGNKFIKWDDESSMGVPVTLKVDPKGYILYWMDQNKEMDFLDISNIRDTRTGKYAKIPKSALQQLQAKDSRLRDTVMMGAQDVALDEKMVTIVYSSDMVNVSYINFAATSREVAKKWTEELFKYSTNLLASNASPLAYLEKCYEKLSLVTNTNGKIPVRNIVKMFAQHRDDRRKVEKALETSRLPSGKNDQISPIKFTFDDFLTFYRHLCSRHEVEKLFHELGAKNKPYLTVQQFVEFLNKSQRDPRLNEILYPYCDVKKAQGLIDHFEPNHSMSSKDPDVPPGNLSQEGFLRYLLSDENALVPPEKFDINEDMDQPLSHYFINSSHNTYLTGHQLTGKSSVEIYRQALLTGCRCVELDCWDGKGADEEPIITHGFTMCTEIIFKEVIEAIAETAFKVSDYPVILSFENHCSPKQQAKMAQHCRNILGDSLLTDTLESNPLDPAVVLPSPEQMRRKVIVKNKKRHIHKSKTRVVRTPAESRPGDTATEATTETEAAPAEEKATDCVCLEAEAEAVIAEHVGEVLTDSETESEEEDEEGIGEEEAGTVRLDKKEKATVSAKGRWLKLKELIIIKKHQGTAGQEAEAGMEMSALVNYIQPARFHSFEYADNRNRSYECISFVETHATALLKLFPVDFVNFNKRQLSRIYPKGTRVDSSNYMPQIFWNAGCQLVALNFQTLDLAMQLNLGIFEYNGRSGFILKPDFMRRKDRRFDPFAESTVDGIVAGTVQVKVLSGQFLTDKKLGTYVEVDMYGLPADTVRKRFKTKVIPATGVCPQYEEETFLFKKVVLPNLATLRFAVYDENNRMLGHRVLPVEGLRPGYRHICLRNELNQPQGVATLFVHITVGDYVPDAFADFAEALSNPIAHLSQLEKRAEQLAALEEDFDVQDEEEKEQTLKEAASLTRARNTSVMSKQSIDTPVISRVGSQHAKQLVKQESTNSQGSQGSAPAPVAAGKVSGTSSSLPASPMHAVTTATAMTSSPENGAVKPATVKIDIMQTTQLRDPDVLETVSLGALRENKPFSKFLQKLEKEMDSLRKKHDKARNSMQELHELQEEKLVLSQMKSKTSIEKTQRKSIHKASKRGNPSDVSHKNQEEMNMLLTEQEKRHKDLKKSQMESYVCLCKDQYQTELELQLKYHPLLHNTLDTLVVSSRDAQMRQLEDIHNREVVDLKKKLDMQTKEEIKALAKKHKDKNELARVKREANQKLINLAVQERQKLRDLLEKRKAEVEDKHEVLKKVSQEEKSQKEVLLQDEFEEKCSKLEKEQQAALQLSSYSQRTSGEAGTGTATGAHLTSSSSASSTPVHTADTRGAASPPAPVNGDATSPHADRTSDTPSSDAHAKDAEQDTLVGTASEGGETEDATAAENVNETTQDTRLDGEN